MAEERMYHKLTLEERGKLTMTGVTEVISFEEDVVVLRTSLGTLIVHGRELQLRTLSLDGGQVAVEGSISALVYEEPKAAGGILRRLFGCLPRRWRQAAYVWPACWGWLWGSCMDSCGLCGPKEQRWQTCCLWPGCSGPGCF